MTEGRDTHYQPWLRDEAETLGNAHRNSPHTASPPPWNADDGAEDDHPRATPHTATPSRNAPSRTEAPTGLDLARYQRDMLDAKGAVYPHNARASAAPAYDPAPAPTRADDYYAAAPASPSASRRPVPGDNVVPLHASRDDGDSWGELAAKGGKKAWTSLKNGWTGFANWTIALGERADIPAKVAALHLDEKAKAAAAATAEASRKAASKTAAVSKIAANKTAEVSKIAANKTAEASKVAANRTAELSKSAANRTAELSKSAANRTAELSKSAASKTAENVGKLELGSKFNDAAGKAGSLVKQGASSVADATKSATSSVSGVVGDAASQAFEKTSEMMPEIGRGKAADPSTIPSALEQLLAEQEAAISGNETSLLDSTIHPKTQANAPVRQAPALPLFAEVPETVPTQIAPKKAAAVAAPQEVQNGAIEEQSQGKSAPLIIMPGEEDSRDFSASAKPLASPSTDDTDAVIIPLKPKEPSPFAKRWMEIKDRLGTRWQAMQGNGQNSGQKAAPEGSASPSSSQPSGNTGNSGSNNGGNTPPPSAALSGLLGNGAVFTMLGSLLIGGAVYAASGALPPRGLSQEIASGSTPPLAAAGVDRSDRAEIEAIVHDYIMTHPEIIPQALERYQAQQMAKQVDGLRSELETPFAGAWAGAAKGDVVLVEFSDFACGYCRASVNDVERLLKDDPKLKIVHRDLPILSPESAVAAKTALAAAKQGKYRSYYLAQFATGRPSPETIEAAAKKAGLDPVATQKAILNGDIQAELDKNFKMAEQLGFSGTPTFIVGDRILQGAVGYDELKKAVAEARAGD